MNYSQACQKLKGDYQMLLQSYPKRITAFSWLPRGPAKSSAYAGFESWQRDYSLRSICK